MREQATKHVYKAVKFNKCDTQYLIKDHLPKGSILTERVKIEAFQGYSKAYNISEYFRLRGLTSWKSGKQVTGLWRSNFPNIHYGDIKDGKVKTLIIFIRSNDNEVLTIYTFPDGYYPSQKKVNELITELQ